MNCALAIPARCFSSVRLSAFAILLLAIGCNGDATPPTVPSREQPSPLPDESYIPKLNAATLPGPAPEGMVWVPGGEFWMGCMKPEWKDARPLHLVRLDGFWMDKTTVTNEEFARFVKSTGYLTVAEQKPDWDEMKKQLPPGTPKPSDEQLVPGSVVFTPPGKPVDLNEHLSWWRWQPGACWKHPEGPGSDINGRDKHPVVHVCWTDAVAYCHWAKKRLPTEAEWEFAARGGLDRKLYPWGDELKPNGKWMANIWQGRFPYENLAEDGYITTAPVGSFPPNGYGLYDMAGNVWQWCADWYDPNTYQPKVEVNPQGPSISHDPREPGIPKRVQRGGSFLCSDQYCDRYITGTRGKGAVDSGQSHVGFRCVRPAK
jgi:formylglycine-generating enzyme required for sulfatase activity